ncbi:50S ribosomal protein L13 [Thalassoglobus polymorphus]|uniref:Large ribosomal subunit protein uL13 n=1 Tax=Thalassoglobus polymorphus TaxID=2527994 RepID=A0A517QN13_9PLAN|nr:50S ribosomal protein L13 [Thalassoglobus polymorphus]QDT32974.1 50S ribosomal protein L13 [Thalassoglobus polymorphus]
MQTVQKTTVAKKEEVVADWYLVDAKDAIVGRLATRIAVVLMGKHKPIYTPHVDCGDFVVVTNCDRVRFSGKKLSHDENPNFTKKMATKEYDYYTGYPGGHRVNTGAELLEQKPTKILEEAVRRMLPKNKLGRKMLKKLKLYAGSSHPHQAQSPQDLPS